MKHHEMNCDAIESELPLHVGGDLDPENAGRVRRHLVDCGSCRAALAALEDSRGVLLGQRDVRDAFTEQDLWPALEARLRSSLEASPTRPTELAQGSRSEPVARRSAPADGRFALGRPSRWMPLGAAAALLIVVGVRGGFDGVRRDALREDGATPPVLPAVPLASGATGAGDGATSLVAAIPEVSGAPSASGTPAATGGLRPLGPGERALHEGAANFPSSIDLGPTFGSPRAGAGLHHLVSDSEFR